MTIDLGSTFATYNYLSKNLTTSLAQEAADPANARATAYFEENIGKITSIDDFVNNYQLFNYAMSAFGLEDMAYAKAYMKKVLESDLTDTSSFANKLSDSRFEAFATAFGGLKDGTAVDSTTITTTVNNYLQQSMEDNAGESDPGVQLALYFERNASGIKSAYDILADEALTEVVKTFLGLPDEMANADIDAQAKAITERIDIADLQDPDYVSKVLKQFTVLYDIENNSSTDPVLMLFDSSSSGEISDDTLASLMSLKYGGA
ncbi:flagellar basal body rod protein FlgF [Azorhizobium oxalatiphilum]|uniref:Flagellar basal body rod protein FlgF n=1 Tax=Azorhizobium oxalatiphilum TaxID=980631 RepID=A0A917BZP3_9HYPH|nr:DUF1217 domain-containing protein [Azorhizobium oxalatiphilum]GGF60985.1 flagellar basal body rod protein FlgF [Azorhizobium oxalatiphilum]